MNLRTRLVVGVLTVAAGTLLVAAALSGLEGRSALGRLFDEELVRRIQEARPIGTQIGALPIGFCSVVRQLQLIDERGVPISQCLGVSLPKPSDGALREARAHGLSLRYIDLAGAKARQVILELPRYEGERPLFLQAAEPLKELLEEQEDLARRTWILFGGAFVFLVVAVYVAINIALRKAARLAAAARAFARGDEPGRLEEEKSEDELGLLVRMYNQVLDRMDRVAAAHRRFVADAARELAQPLAALRADLDAIDAAGAPPEKLRAAVAAVGRELQRFSRLIDALILFARLDAGLERVPAEARADLAEIVRAALRRAESRLAERQVRAEAEIDESVRVRGVPALLEIVVENVLDNAVRHAREGGQVRVQVRARDGEGELVVEEDGPGIAPEERQRVFERFARGASGGAWGLGLPLARDVIGLHGGTIALSESPLGGARFEIRLPT